MQDGPASTNPHRQNTASPGYADLCRAQAKPLSIIVACCTLVATSYSESILAFLNQFASIYSFSFFVMLFALMLPGRLFLLSIPLAAGALDALSRMNQLKISSVFLPITFFDVGMVIADPSVLVNALGIRDSFYRMVFIAVGLIGFALAVSIFYRIWCYSFPDRLKLSRSCGQTRTQSFLLNAVALVFILIALLTCLGRYGRFVHAHLTTQASNLGLVLWLPSSQVTLSRELGVLEYMAFSFAANEKADIFLEHGPGPTVRELRLAAAEFVNSPVHHSKALLPNIVFFHAESTFDPALAFKLSAPVKLPIWSKQRETRVLSPLRVNIIGGGSWVTEFEVITGVDSRIFGYHGFYTHFHIAPKVKNTFVEYLVRKGYKTAAFYPVEGSF